MARTCAPQVKLGLSYLIPNGQIGTFGSTLPLKSIVKNHKDLFDIAIAGPAAGGAASLMLFIAGLALSQGNPSQASLTVNSASASFRVCMLDDTTLINIPAETLSKVLGQLSSR